MKFGFPRLRLGFLISVSLILLSSCQIGDKDEEAMNDAEDLKKLAKLYLTEGEPQAAQEMFQLVLSDYNPDDAEAHFGVALSETMTFVEFVNLLISLLGGLGKEGLSIQQDDENQFIIDLVTSLLLSVGERFELMLVHLILASNDPNFKFTIDDLPVVVDGSERINLRGEWGNPELYLMLSGVEMMVGMLELLASQDLHADFIGVYEYIAAAGFNNIDVATILETVAFLLNTSPKFMTLNTVPDEDGDDGLHFWDLGKTLLEASAEHSVIGMDHLAKGTDRGDVIRLLTDPEDREKHVISFDGLVKEIDDLGKPEYIDVSIGFESIYSLMVALDQNINVDAKDNVSWNDDLMPVLIELILSVLDVINVMGVDLPPEFESVLDIINANTVRDLVAVYVPDVFQFSFGNFISYPTESVLTAQIKAGRTDLDFRNFFPVVSALRNNKTGLLDHKKNTLLLEWECELPVVTYSDGTTGPGLPTGEASMLCAEDATLTDSDHFPDPAHAEYAEFYEGMLNYLPASADGIESRLPYIPFGDASLKGMLFLNPCSPDFADPGIPAYIPDEAGCFNTATAETLNAIIHALAGPLIDLLTGI